MYTLSPCSLGTSPWRVSESPCWETLHDRMRPRLHHAARRLLRHEQDAEDAVQETFLRTWTGADTLRDPGALEGWMCAVLRHVACDMVRRRRPTFHLDTVPEDRREARPGTLEEWRDLVAHLPDGQAQVLLAVASGERVTDVARAAGIRRSAAKTRPSRAPSPTWSTARATTSTWCTTT
jgi:RNA polymerase sigma-70 factor (ECF subfamily)